MIPKFRGFRTETEEWVEGNLIYREEPYQHDIVTPIGNCSTISYAVERDSIGQWTGLKDKNGVEIYEGDILYHPLQGKRKVYYPYSDSVASYGLREINTGFGSTLQDAHAVWQVIGNIYQNQELLEVAE